MSSNRPISQLLAGTCVDPDRPFSAPWEALAFAIALELTERGLCTWNEFRRHLIERIGQADQARAHGWIEAGEGYYTHFLLALEDLLREKGVVDSSALAAKMLELGDPDH